MHHSGYAKIRVWCVDVDFSAPCAAKNAEVRESQLPGEETSVRHLGHAAGGSSGKVAVPASPLPVNCPY